MQEKRSHDYKSIYAVITGLIFITLAAIYALYVRAQNSNTFFESQFLHYEFLKELVAGRFTAQGFFTVFGEHLFPGYNLILAANYYLFHIWGGFDSIVYAFFLIFTAGIVVSRVYMTTALTPANKVVVSSFIALLLLSTTNNPQWGMALAAAGGVFLFTLSAMFVEDALWEPEKKLNPFVFIVLPAAQIFFLGGYAIGSIATFGALLLIHTVQNRRPSSKAIAIVTTVAASLAIYLLLVTHYGDLTANKPTSIGINIWLIIKFAVLMTGASVFGKAFFEHTHVLWLYYLLGSILIGLTLCVWVEFIRQPRKGQIFILALSIYSAATIVTVAFFRYRNGLDGALGQWYNVHTHFIAVAIVYWLCVKFQGHSYLKKTLCFLVLVGIFFSSSVGYVSDWSKAPYIREYKEKFAAQAEAILSFPETIQNKNDPFQTMLWDYDSVKQTLDLMYAHKLWIFKISALTVSGVTHDDWLESDKPVTVMCPAESQSLHFRIWRKEEWDKSVLNVHTGGKTHELAVTNGDVVIALSVKAHAVMLDASDVAKSQPIKSPSDIRSLVAKVVDFQCRSTP